ncbi:GH32 C-terminal domain-containing protein [Exiguobacterium sp. s7]|uniref:glycoside hydrolase family 32 protein n=1 Tax=Exiguobacterium sp. s7 TaxID=2751235 RepID=UPI001BE61D36
MSSSQEWQYLGVLGESDGTEGYMWECPVFFELDGEHILLFSPQGMKPEGDRYQNLFQTGCVTGSFEYETNTFERGDFQELDHDHDFYAVQTLLDDKGRRIAIGWMDMWESEMPTKEHGWAGALTLPRVLSRSENGRIKMEPVEDLKVLCSKWLDVQLTTIEETEIVMDVAGELLELEVEFSLSDVTADTFGIKLRRSEDGSEETVIRFSPQTRQLTLDRTKSGTGVDGIRTAEVDVEGDVLQLRIFLDRFSVEVFADAGTTVMTSPIYPDPTSLGLSFYAEGGSVNVKTCNVWQLKDVWTEQ